MRSLATVSALFVLAILAEPGRTQFGCTSPYCQSYPRSYMGYGVSSSNYYYGQPPPYLMGGPAYGYTYPTPWYGYCPYPQGPKSYIAPPYQMVYQPGVHTQSMYTPYGYYPQATMKNPVSTKAKGTPLPGKEPPAPPKTPTTDKQDEKPMPASTKKSSLWKRLIYW